jgi:2-oxoglutarate dehydrogenase E2 component (dihydrolipoamide succinyltransferase)
MAEIKVIMPQMGESIVEGTVTKWLKNIGDPVERDEPLFEISTDKIDSEIPAPVSGTLVRIVVEEDETVEINTVVAYIESSDPAPDEGTAPDARPDRDVAPAAPPAAPPKPPTASADQTSDVNSSPMVRRLAEEHGVDITELDGKGTGAGGRITKRDILSFIEQQGETSTSGADDDDDSDDDDRAAMTPMRKSIADHMIASRKTSAHVATIFEVDCSAISAARSTLKPEFERAGAKLTMTAFFAAAVAQTLGKYPILNSSVDGDEIVHHGHINIGIAVALDDGLLVPVVRDADKAKLLDLARSIADLGARARTKKLLPDEVQGGTFTLTNPGIFGGLYGIPIINQPQVAILAIGGIEKRPVVIEDSIAIRPMAYLALSFDHRIIDGAVADQFMSEVKQKLENWKA